MVGVTAVADWQIETDADDAAAYAVLAADRAWNGYSIADLEPPFRQWTKVALACRNGTAEAACLFLRHPAFNAVVPTGDPDGLGAILEAVELPAAADGLVREPHRAAIERHYAVPEPRRMVRMAVDRAAFRPPTPNDAPAPVRRLGPADLAALTELLAEDPEHIFHADQLAIGPFYGIDDPEGRLAAAAGIHVVAPGHRIAAVGNVHTRTDCRGRGYARAVTAAVVAGLLATCDDVILNVAHANAPARRIYERLGFRTHCEYWEGRLERRDA